MKLKRSLLALFAVVFSLVSCNKSEPEEIEIITNTSFLNEWSNFEVEELQTGSFTAEFDMKAEKNNIDALVGFQDGEAAGYGDLSAIVRFTGTGVLDARNGGGYAADAEIPYIAGQSFHFRMEIDVINMKYDVFVTPEGGSEVQLASEYGFRDPAIRISHWSMIAGDWNIEDPGTHDVSGMKITTKTVNEYPVFDAQADVKVEQDMVTELLISAADPQGADITLSATLPDFIKFLDLGDGRAKLTISPTADDAVAKHDITITADNGSNTTDLTFAVYVIEPASSVEIHVDPADWTVSAFRPGGDINFIAAYGSYKNLFAGVVNYNNADGEDLAAVMPFALPEIPEGKKIRSAYLKINLVAVSAGNYDLHAVDGSRAASEVLATDHYVGPAADATNSTLIQSGLVQGGVSVPGDILSSDDSAINLANFMNELYTAGSSAGEFVFLRINADVTDLANNQNMLFMSSAANADASVETEPVLVVTFGDL